MSCVDGKTGSIKNMVHHHWHMDLLFLVYLLTDYDSRAHLGCRPNLSASSFSSHPLPFSLSSFCTHSPPSFPTHSLSLSPTLLPSSHPFPLLSPLPSLLSPGVGSLRAPTGLDPERHSQGQHPVWLPTGGLSFPGYAGGLRPGARPGAAAWGRPD